MPDPRSSTFGRRSFLRGLAAGATVIGGSGLLAACGSSSSATSTAGGAAAGAEGGSATFLKYLAGGYNDEVGIAFEAAAKQLGLKGGSGDGKGDASTQLQAFEQALVRGDKAVGVNFVDGINVANMAKTAQQNDAFLVGSWSVPPYFTAHAAVDSYTYLSPDDYRGAYKAAEELVKALDGKGTVVLVRGPQSNTTDVNRGEALAAVLREHPGIRVAGQLYTDWTPEQGEKSASSLLARYPDAAAVWAADDHIATGVIAAIKGVGKVPGKDILVVGHNGNPEAIERVKAGTQLVSSSTIPSYLGYGIAVQIHDRLNGWKPEVGERQLVWEPIAVTTKNVDQYIARFVDQPSSKHFDARKLSRTLTPDGWTTGVRLYPLTPDEHWAGTKKPKGFSYPEAYTTALSDGTFDRTRAAYAKRAPADPLAA
jgi:ABC-type sugar transport system substrate-binding protein